MAANANDDLPPAAAITRRVVVGGAAIGFAAATIPIFAKGANRTMADVPLTNPTTKYPKPSFEKQTRPGRDL